LWFRGAPRMIPLPLRPPRLARGALGHGTAAVPRWLVQGTAAGFLTRMAMLIGGSGMFSAGSQPGLDGTLRAAWVGIAGCAVGNAGGRQYGQVSGRHRAGGRRAPWSAR